MVKNILQERNGSGKSAKNEIELGKEFLQYN